jgi:hypothetical protein
MFINISRNWNSFLDTSFEVERVEGHRDIYLCSSITSTTILINRGFNIGFSIHCYTLYKHTDSSILGPIQFVLSICHPQRKSIDHSALSVLINLGGEALNNNEYISSKKFEIG